MTLARATWKAFAGGIVLLLAVALLSCVGLEKKTVIPVRPKMGDEAVVLLQVVRPEYYPETGGILAIAKFDNYRLLVRCTKARGAVREFSVYRLRRGSPPALAYNFTVCYATKRLEDMTTVRVLKGRRVPPGKYIERLPVPFHYFLVFGEKQVGVGLGSAVVQKMSGGQVAVLRRMQLPDGWLLLASIRGPGDKRLESEWWEADHWMWRVAKHNVGQHEVYYAWRLWPKPHSLPPKIEPYADREVRERATRARY